jgi:hypothetical protein
LNLSVTPAIGLYSRILFDFILSKTDISR